MKQGFIKVAAVTPTLEVADPEYNKTQICLKIDETIEKGAKILVFPELCITGYTCSDLFWQELLLAKAKEQLAAIANHTLGKDALIFVGLPFEKGNKLFNVLAVVHNGKVLGFVPKTNIPNYSEFYEARHFTAGNRIPEEIEWQGDMVPFGANLLFSCKEVEGLVVAAEICEDIWVPLPPSTNHALQGATVIVNGSASDETIAKDSYRNSLIGGQSARLLCAYIYVSCGEGESTTDVVFGGHNIIAENGIILAESKRFVNETTYADVDIHRLRSERRHMTTFLKEASQEYQTIDFHLNLTETKLERKFYPLPFVPSDKKNRDKRCEEILSIQSMGLKKRLKHTNCKSAVIGISGGLDSTLALLVTVRAFDMLSLDRKNILTVTMPCFGTTDRTYQNACQLAKQMGTTLMEVNIKESVTKHFEDIGHDINIHDVTYENGQARERTQVLMDIANKRNGIVIGTGDMSELALGWATYNGDHMSMYGVNVSVPKTLVKHLVYYYAETCEDKALELVLKDVLDTPVSPELLPPSNGEISQKTEDIVGPYELHDFFLYYLLRFGYEPKKIIRVAMIAFEGVYDREIIVKWLKVFYRRFFSQQFKRSCLPDGPKVGTVALSPRGDLRMPSDASARLWIGEIE